MAIKKKKVAKKKVAKKSVKATKKATKKVGKSSAKTTKKVSSKKTSVKKAAKRAAAKKPVKATKKKVSQKKSGNGHHVAHDHDDHFEDYTVYTLSAPDQPVNYDIVEAASRQELIQLVRDRLYISHDGSAWIPQGPAFEEDHRWYQTMVMYV